MKRFSNVCLAALAAAGTLLPGCSSTSATQLKAQSDGTLAVTKDGQYLYAVSADDDTLAIVNAFTYTQVASVTVGQQPARVIVGPDETIYVSNRGSRSVSVIHRGNDTPSSWTLASSLAVNADPIGLALSADGSTLYVVASAAATLQAVELSSGATRWQTSLGAEPRAVAVLPDGRLYVTHYKSGSVDIVDGQSGNLLGATSVDVGVDPNSAAGSIGFVSSLPAFRPVGLDSIVVSHDGSRAYFVHRRDRAGLLAGNLTTPVVVPAVTTVELATDTARDDATDPTKDFPPPVIFPGPSNSVSAPPPGCESGGNGSTGTVFAGSGNSGGIGGGPDCIGVDCTVFPDAGGNGGSTAYGVQSGGSSGGSCTPETLPWTQGPVAAIEDPTGLFMYVANLNSDNVTILSTTNRTTTDPTTGNTVTQNGVMQLIPVGTAPSGLALSADGKTLYVHNSIDHSISFVRQDRNCDVDAPICEINRVQAVGSIGTLDPVAASGRQLFFSATDPAMTVPGGGIACESCHLGGSSDGNVWQFPFGPRKTPNLLGRKVENTAPYHWDGTEADFTHFFAETIQMRMGGSGLQTAVDPTSGQPIPSQDQPTQIETYLQGLQTPDNPFVQAGGLTAAQAAGKSLFAGKAGCIACHTGPNFTDNGFHDVGSLVTNNPNGVPDDVCRVTPTLPATPCIGTDGPDASATANPANTAHGFNTPSLLGVVWAAPYLHSGAAATLKDRLLENPGDAHGTTSTLSSDEIDDLVQYLQTL